MTYTSINHQEFYNQRYGKALPQKAQEAYQKKMDEYKAIKEQNKARKTSLQASAEMVFREHGIPYEVRGQAWLCVVEGGEYYYYPKSGKWKIKGGDPVYYSRGALDFLGKIQRYNRMHSS
jgi:hypothetical protein